LNLTNRREIESGQRKIKTNGIKISETCGTMDKTRNVVTGEDLRLLYSL
jgi:hypothetical protein